MSTLDVSDSSDIAKWTGRPNGSTDNEKREDSMKLLECINSIALNYSTQKSKCLSPKSRLRNGFLCDLINSKKKDYGVSIAISEETIKSQYKEENSAKITVGWILQ